MYEPFSLILRNINLVPDWDGEEGEIEIGDFRTHVPDIFKPGDIVRVEVDSDFDVEEVCLSGEQEIEGYILRVDVILPVSRSGQILTWPDRDGSVVVILKTPLPDMIWEEDD